MQETTSLKSTPGLQARSPMTHCPYCAFQCGMYLLGPGEQATVTGEATFPVNRGRLCIKGWTAPATLAHLERLLTPWHVTPLAHSCRSRGTRHSCAWWGPFVIRKCAMAGTPLASSVVGRSPTRRPTCWASSLAWLWGPRASTIMVVSVCRLRRQQLSKPSAWIGLQMCQGLPQARL